MNTLTAEQYFETQAYYNKWLKELTETEKQTLIEMLTEYHNQFSKEALPKEEDDEIIS